MSIKIKNKTIAYSTCFLSVMLILGYIENIIPVSFIGYFGLKLGLTNIVTLISLKILNVRMTFIINLLRIIILGFLFGIPLRAVMSLSGFIFSFVITLICMYGFKFGMVSTSIFGAVFHYIGQFIVVIYLVGFNAAYLIPFYIIIGIVSGLIIGIISDLIYTKLSLFKIE